MAEAELAVFRPIFFDVKDHLSLMISSVTAVCSAGVRRTDRAAEQGRRWHVRRKEWRTVLVRKKVFDSGEAKTRCGLCPRASRK